METPKVKCVKCWIDEQGIVWSHDCEGKATPATAIPDEVVVKVREGLEQIARAYGDAAASDRPQFMLACQVASEAARNTLSLLGDTP